MSLFDFFFPEQAQASHLRRLAEQHYRAERYSEHAERRSQDYELRITDLERRVLDTERDLGFVSLLLGSLLNTLDKNGVVNHNDVRSALEELDTHDGFRDGQLDIDKLREWGNQRR